MSVSSRLSFRIDAKAKDSQARATTFQTLHNTVTTPLFMPVGTQATVKAQRTQTLEDAGSQVLLANTYHLLLRPGIEVFRRSGGIHGFMSWQHSVLTDSGGFQIFSLPHSRSITEEGAVFQSYLDGRRIVLSPETSIETQRAIGSDIMMALDQCVPSTVDEQTAINALGITHRWAKRSLKARGDSQQALFGIVQGALFPSLRKESVETICGMGFDGFAIGGLAVGEAKAEREETCELTAALLPENAPRYLMGVGTPLDILEAVHRGVDMFDCIIPTQFAQRGGVFTSRGILQLRRGIYKFSQENLDPDCACPTCQRYTRAYLHHLTKAVEPLGWQLLGQHNLYFYHRLMREIRSAILQGTFLSLYHEKRRFLQIEDIDNPITPPRRNKPPRTTLGAYKIHTAFEGFSSIVHIVSGEIMHSRMDPTVEARQLYVEQSRLTERLKDRDYSNRELVIWDVGLGSAANAMAAIRCYEASAKEMHAIRPMRIVSFENDLDSLRLAFHRNELFPYLRHGGPSGILKHGEWQSKELSGLRWNLVEGDFLKTMTTVSWIPDIIFYDMFSGNTCAEQWSTDCFQKLFSVCGQYPVELFTYTNSTVSRVAMLTAGFYLAHGRSVGAKEETTIALTPLVVEQETDYPHLLLGEKWLGRWHRSSAKFPKESSLEERMFLEQAVLRHPQFCSAGNAIKARL